MAARRLTRLAQLTLGILAFLLTLEAALRLLRPGLGSNLSATETRRTNFQFGPKVGFEYAPYARVRIHPEDGPPIVETRNSEGFRGREYALPKPENTTRILVIGDSIVDGLTVGMSRSWPSVLESLLNQQASTSGSHRQHEVINAGVAGYMSWQAVARLERRGLKYQPDLVLVLVGWNDLLLSSLASWKPGMYRERVESSPPSSRVHDFLRTKIYPHSYVARLVKRALDRMSAGWRARNSSTHTQQGSGRPFNQAALDLYRGNLERAYSITHSAGARMALLLWPTLLSPESLGDSTVQQRLAATYAEYPLAASELWLWYQKYQELQKDLAREHTDVLLIDAASTFRSAQPSKRQRLFTDAFHLTASGHRLLATTVFTVLQDQPKHTSPGTGGR